MFGTISPDILYYSIIHAIYVQLPQVRLWVAILRIYMKLTNKTTFYIAFCISLPLSYSWQNPKETLNLPEPNLMSKISCLKGLLP